MLCEVGGLHARSGSRPRPVADAVLGVVRKKSSPAGEGKTRIPVECCRSSVSLQSDGDVIKGGPMRGRLGLQEDAATGRYFTWKKGDAIEETLRLG